MKKMVACSSIKNDDLSYNFAFLLKRQYREKSFLKNPKELKDLEKQIKVKLLDYSKLLHSGRFKFIKWEMAGLWRIPIIMKV